MKTSIVKMSQVLDTVQGFYLDPGGYLLARKTMLKNTDIISISFPSSHAIVTALTDFSNIIANSAHDVYKVKHTSITLLWKKAQHIRFRHKIITFRPFLLIYVFWKRAWQTKSSLSTSLSIEL